MRHFTRTEDFSKEDFLEVFRRTEIFQEGLKSGKDFTHLCPGKVMASMFFQESSRTSATIKAAITRLGGGWFGVDGIKGTYLEAGEEDLEDTLNGVAPICDIMAIRHKELDLTKFAKNGMLHPVPLINAMCGGEEHSIGGVGFIYSLKRKLGKLENVKIGLYGMGKSSRPIKACVKVASHFGVEIIEDPVIEEMRLPDHILEQIVKNGSKHSYDKLENFLDKVDCLLVVEGLPQAGEDPALVEKFNQAFTPLSNEYLAKMKETAAVGVVEPRAMTDGRLVALKETDNDPRMFIKDMISEVTYINMAIITILLGIDVN